MNEKNLVRLMTLAESLHTGLADIRKSVYCIGEAATLTEDSLEKMQQVEAAIERIKTLINK